MDEWVSPDKKHTAKWRWGGEMWMSGPEWGYLSIANKIEIKGVLPEVVWSENSDFLAFVKLHIEDVPTRQGAEGMSFRVGVLRTSDFSVHYCLGNRKLAAVKLRSITPQSVTVLVNGKEKTISLENIRWGKP